MHRRIRNFLKDTLNMLLMRRPIGLRMGNGSWILPPYVVLNRKHVSIGSNTYIRKSAHIEPILKYANVFYSPTININDNVYIGSNVYISAINQVTIEAGCVLSDYVFLSDASHGFDLCGEHIIDQPLKSRGPINIKRNTFLGQRVFVMPGVTLGEHCIVGANSVVTKSFPAHSVIGGVPARLIRHQVHST